MRRLIGVVAILATTNCASTSLPRSDTYGAPPETVWRAALVAVEELGGRVVTAGHSDMFILGRLEGTAIGSTVTLEITVREWMDGAEVRVKASTPDSPAGVSPGREDALRRLEEDFLDLVRRLTGAGIRAQRPRAH